jgi:hypothetical protein
VTGRWDGQDGAIPFVVVGVVALGGVLGLAWTGQEWAQSLLNEAGGTLTAWVLNGAFWALDLIALQASTTPVTRDWYTPVLEGVALPIYALAALVMVATLVVEVIAGIATGNTARTVQAVFRALLAGMMASAGGSILLAVGGALSDLGRIALAASGTSVDAPLVPLQEVLMDSALQRDSGAELFVVFLAGLVIVFCSLAIYFTLAMRPVLLAALIVFLPVAHALSVWTPLRRVQVRAWSLAFAVLLSDAAILTMFAITNSVTGQPEGVDRLIFGTFGVLLAALAPAALARIVGTPELHTAVQSMTRGTKVVAAGAAVGAARSALFAGQAAGRGSTGGAGLGGGAGPGPVLAGGASGGPGPGGGHGSTRGGGSGGTPSGGRPGALGTSSGAASHLSTASSSSGTNGTANGPAATSRAPSSDHASSPSGSPRGARSGGRPGSSATWHAAIHGRSGRHG